MVPAPANQEPAPVQAQQGHSGGPYTLTVSTIGKDGQANTVTQPSVATSPNRNAQGFRGQPAQRKERAQRPSVQRTAAQGAESASNAPGIAPPAVRDRAVVDVSSGMVIRVRNPVDVPAHGAAVAAAHRSGNSPEAARDPYDRLKEKTTEFFRTPPSRSVSSPPLGQSWW
ncbi:MAG: hypothetical protein HY914_05635 [Desulfomonile tiedjei]|nr:hypothetical protein [Desulfomonile tiedjei]